MRANYHTDYALRLLIVLQLKPNERMTTREIAELFGISVNHLNKVSQKLVRMGLLTASRGRGGGVELAPGTSEQKVGDLMKQLDPDEEVAQCRGGGTLAPCKISPACRLRSIFAEAKEAFWKSLNQYTIADLVKGNSGELKALLF
jgi:Rrf2 family nitric oxide-sensitive transcriptional repressor